MTDLLRQLAPLVSDLRGWAILIAIIALAVGAVRLPSGRRRLPRDLSGPHWDGRTDDDDQ